MKRILSIRGREGYKKYWNSLKGKKLSDETKKKISEANKGRKIQFKKRSPHSKETKDKIGLANKGKKNMKLSKILKGRDITWKDKISKTLKGRKQSKEHIRKRLKRKDKSNLEIKFENIINNLNLPYKFVGNGSFFIAGKCPDFINQNGERIAIEVFARIHKEKFRDGGLNKWKKDRKKLFESCGWKIIFFDETQVNEENVKSILGD